MTRPSADHSGRSTLKPLGLILLALKKALAKSGLQTPQVVIICFDTMVIAETKQQIPELKALWLTDFKTDKNSGEVSPSTKEILATLEKEKTGADGVSYKAQTNIDQQFMRTLRTAHKEVHVWSVDNVAAARWKEWW